MTTIQVAPPVNPTPSSALAAPPPTMASPSWWGADSTRFRADHPTEGSVFVKTHTAQARTYVDVPSAVRATDAAGAAGLGPKVLGHGHGTGQLVLEDLTDTHATATLGDFADRGRRHDYFGARARFRSLEIPGLRSCTVFDDIRGLRAQIASLGATLPEDVAWIEGRVDEIDSRITALGFDPVPIQGDANCSNVMLRRDGTSTMLLDFDWAAHADPLQDIGSILLEFAYTEHEGRVLFAEAWGSFDEGLYARARLYGVAEAFRAALIGVLADRLDPGTQEYSKFSDWMFLRTRAALTDRVTDDHMRNAQ